MNKKSLLKRIISFVFIISISVTAVFAQDAVGRAMDLLNRNIILKEYQKAYSYAQFIIKYYNDDGLPDEELAAVQKAVKGYADDLEKNENWDVLLELEDGLKNAPASVRVVAQTNFQHAHDYFTAVEAEKERQRIEKQRQEEEEQRMIEEIKKAEREKQIKEEQKAEKEAENQKIMELIQKQYNADLAKEKLRKEEQLASAEKQLEIEKMKQESDDLLREQIQIMMTEMNKNNTETMKSVSSNNKSVMIIVIVLVSIFLIVIVFLVLISYRQNKNNQEQMKNTILTMQAMRSAQPLIDVLPLPLQLENRTLELAGNVSTKPSMLLEDKSTATDATVVNTEQPEVLKNLLISCKQYGEQIDRATGRKNVTSQVAELVYKISQTMGYSENEAILYYAAALVYDIGFLNISPQILQAETLSNEQFMLLKTHTTIGQNMVFFVDEKNRELFKDAAGKHHENLDGTGYPEGLKGEQIPFIARVIRVVESYIALISQRQYKEIHDRNFAIQELKNAPKQYDIKIVEVLDQIV